MESKEKVLLQEIISIIELNVNSINITINSMPLSHKEQAEYISALINKIHSIAKQE